MIKVGDSYSSHTCQLKLTLTALVGSGLKFGSFCFYFIYFFYQAMLNQISSYYLKTWT